VFIFPNTFFLIIKTKNNKIKRYPIPLSLAGHSKYAFFGDNQEGLVRDDAGYLYIAQNTYRGNPQGYFFTFPVKKAVEKGDIVY